MTVTIAQLPLAALVALADADAASARVHSPVPVSDWVCTDEDCVSTWRRRAVQVAETPRDEPWVTGVVLADGEPVGQAGFHEAPDESGTVEVGYKIDPAFRGRGLAKATLANLLDRAREAPEVHRVLASVGPWNAVSLHLVRSRGFVVIGEEIDEEDGLELVHALDVTARPTGLADTRLVVLRGNSGSGKTTVARTLQRGRDRDTAWVSQDLLRREVLRLRDETGSPVIDLIDQTVRFALDRGRHVVLDGILGSTKYGAMLRCLSRDHAGRTSAYVWHLPFEETVRRHATKPVADDFGEPEMRAWFNPAPLVPGLDERILGPEISVDEAVRRIRAETGL